MTRIQAIVIVIACMYQPIAGSTADAVIEFQTAQKVDDLYESGLTGAGYYTTVTPPIFREQKESALNERDWALSRSDNLCAVLETARKEPVSRSDGYSEPHRMLTVFDQKRSGQKQIMLRRGTPIHDYSKSMDMTSSVVDIHAADSETLTLMADKFLFAFGRGICKRIISLDDTDTLTQAGFNGESCLRFKGQSRYMSGIGTWEVYVVPSASYMVRYAKFVKDNEVKLEISTYGTTRHGDCFCPEKTELKIFPESINIVHTFFFTSAKLEFDSVFFAQVQKDFDAEMPDGSIKIDTTSGKDIVQVIGGEEPTEFAMPEKSFSWLKMIILGVNAAGILLLLYLYFRNKKRLNK